MTYNVGNVLNFKTEGMNKLFLKKVPQFLEGDSIYAIVARKNDRGIFSENPAYILLFATVPKKNKKAPGFTPAYQTPSGFTHAFLNTDIIEAIHSVVADQGVVNTFEFPTWVFQAYRNIFQTSELLKPLLEKHDKTPETIETDSGRKMTHFPRTLV